MKTDDQERMDAGTNVVSTAELIMLICSGYRREETFAVGVGWTVI